MRKVTTLILIVLLGIALIGCGGNETEPPPNGTENPPNGEDPEPVVLRGYNLKDLGLELDLERLKIFPGEYETEYRVNNFEDNRPVNPSTCNLLMDYWSSVEEGTVALLCLQGYKKPVEPDLKLIIEICSIQYPLEELDHCKLHEDEETLVYDISSLLPAKIALEYDMQDWLNDFHTRGLPSEWLKEIFEYVQTYEDIVIKRLSDD